MAFLLVQHLDPTHSSFLVEILSKKTRMPIEEAREAIEILPDHIYVLPPNKTLTLAANLLHLTSRETIEQRYSPVNILSARFSGMPKSAIETGCVDFVLSPKMIARERARMGRHPYLNTAVSPITGLEGLEASSQTQQELEATRNFLQATIEEQEAAKEELKSAHEELLSVNHLVKPFAPDVLVALIQSLG